MSLQEKAIKIQELLEKMKLAEKSLNTFLNEHCLDILEVKTVCLSNTEGTGRMLMKEIFMRLGQNEVTKWRQP